jgi:hypothetical protein
MPCPLCAHPPADHLNDGPHSSPTPGSARPRQVDYYVCEGVESGVARGDTSPVPKCFKVDAGGLPFYSSTRKVPSFIGMNDMKRSGERRNESTRTLVHSQDETDAALAQRAASKARGG